VVRINLDQTLGTRWQVSAGVDVTHNFFQRGIGGNDNSGTSPIYTFGYSPAIVDLQSRDASGRYIRMPFNGGGSGTSNPFEVLDNVVNKEDVWRQAGNVRVNFTALSTAKNSVTLSYLGGVDRFQQEGYQYSPNFLQFEPADNFLGTANQVDVSSFQFNQGVNAVWTYTIGNKWLTSLTSSGRRFVRDAERQPVLAAWSRPPAHRCRRRSTRRTSRSRTRRSSSATSRTT
jgi:hypothetical protein